MKRKILSILLCIAVCMTMMPAMGYAEGENQNPVNYSWVVAGTEVTSANADNITGADIKLGTDGKVSYNPEDNTLTLKDATITNNEEYGAGIKCSNGNNKPPTIVIEGNNNIEASSNGIGPYESTVRELTIKSEDGKGSLEVKGTLGINCVGLFSNSAALTLSNVTVEATGTNGYGIYADNITLENTVVTATGTAKIGESQISSYCGIKSDGTLTLTKSRITAKSGNSSSSAISAAGGIIAENAELEGASGTTFTSGTTTSLNADDKDKYVTLRNNFKEYGLWVGGVQVTEKNKGNVLGDAEVSVSYDASSNILTLNNAAITGSHTDGGKSAAVMAVLDDSNRYPDIKIALIGTNTINTTTSTDENTEIYGIYTPKDISVTNGSSTGSAGTVTIESNADAIHAGKKTTISDATVMASSTNGGGIYSVNDITLTNANVTATGVNGIKSGYIITTKENATVKAEGTTGYGIFAENNITFNNSDIEAKGNNGNAIVSKNGKITCTAEMSPMKNGTNVSSEDGFQHIIRAISVSDWVSLKKTTDTLYYNTADGKVYTSYDEDTEKFDVEWDRGGIKGKDDTLTLKDLYFVTTADNALVIPGMTKENTITINCEGENTIRAGYGKNIETCGIQTDANLVINGELTMASSNIKVQGNLQLVDADVEVNKAIADGKLILENAILQTGGYVENDPYSIVTTEGIYYYNNLYGSKEDTADTVYETLSDSNIVLKLGSRSSSFTLHAEAFADFHANGGKWKDQDNPYYDLDRIFSGEKQTDGKRWIAMPDKPTRDGYNFVGWFTEAEGGTQISGDKVEYNRNATSTALFKDYDLSDYSDDAANTYYAHWTKLCENHTFGAWTITKQPTATEKGSKERVCSVCQYKETAEIPATGGSTSGGGSTVTPVQKPEIQPVSGGKTSLSKDGSTLEITPDEGMEIGTVTVNGKEVTVKDGKITGLKTGDKVQVTFKAKAPSKEVMDQKIAETVKELGLTVRTSRTENRNVRVVVQADRKLDTAVQEFKAAGYTVKYKFYRSTKKASGYKRMLIKDTRAYVNTMGDKGTYYYYKARLAVYDAEGKLIAQTDLRQCKAGNRLWIK